MDDSKKDEDEGGEMERKYERQTRGKFFRHETLEEGSTFPYINISKDTSAGDPLVYPRHSSIFLLPIYLRYQRDSTPVVSQLAI